MDTHFDCNNRKDFVIMTCRGELCPNKSVKMRSVGGDKITMLTYEDQLRKLCKEHDLDFLDILTQIQKKLMMDMIKRGNNVPLFKRKVSSILEEWKNSPDYDVLFSLPDEDISFDYNDYNRCNESVLSLGTEMDGLGQLISEGSDELYPRVIQLQKKCREIDDGVKVCMGDLDRLAEYYEPRHPNILLDLSTKPKSFYTNDESSEKLSKMVYHKQFREIPGNIPEIFSNAVFVPNMIIKETDYIREMLKDLKGKLNEKRLLLAELQGNIPEQIQSIDPFTRLFKYFVDSSEEEMEDVEDGIADSDVKPLTDTQVSDINALMESVGAEQDKGGKVEIEEIEEKKKIKEKMKKDDVQETEDSDPGEDEASSGAEKELIELANQNGGGGYELSFF